MRLEVLTIRDVAESQLCCGCGACAFISPDEITMVDALEFGRRPVAPADGGKDPRTREAMKACPGVEVRARARESGAAPIESLRDAWGPILEVWEGYAADPAIRFAGSSGGAASALAIWGIERGGMHGLLHIAARKDAPYLNETVMSTDRGPILAATGSRYAPASPCDGLRLIEDAPRPCVFIGKPCDVAAAEMARPMRPALDRNLGLTIAIFCAGTPSTQGTIEMIRAMGVTDLSSVEAVRYRGNGWPGLATVRARTPEGVAERTMTYADSWGGILQKRRQWRCYICADHTGELADIAVGDPWYREIPEGEPGRSLILVRTLRGKKALEDAIASGYIAAERADPSILVRSQPNLLETRGAVWGRLAMLRLLGAPAPRFPGMPMFRWWLKLSLKEKGRSTIGTVRRIVRRRLKRRVRIEPWTPPVAERRP